MDANKLIFKIFEKSLNIDAAVEIYKRVSNGGELTIGDVMQLKDLLNLTDLEAIDIFLS